MQLVAAGPRVTHRLFCPGMRLLPPAATDNDDAAAARRELTRLYDSACIPHAVPYCLPNGVQSHVLFSYFAAR